MSAGIVFAAIVIGVAVWCVMKKKRYENSLRSNSSSDSHTALRRMAPDPPSGHDSNYSSSGLETRAGGSTGLSAGPIAAAVGKHSTMSSDGTEIGRVTNNEYGRVDDNMIQVGSEYERAPSDVFDSRSPLQQQQQHFDDDSFTALAYGKQ